METDSRVALLNFLSDRITLYCPLIIIVIGTIGCLCNFITFTSIKLRKNSCSFYFFLATVFDLLTLDFGALTRLLADHSGLILYQQIQIYCQIRQYLVTTLPAMATLFIVLATLDRYMSTSSKPVYRRLATVRSAQWIASIASLICILCYIHYGLYAALRPTCALPSGTYGMFAVVYSIVWTSFVPHFLMLWFGYGTFKHITRARRRVFPVNLQQRRVQRTENQLVTMILFQVGISSLLILTRIAYFSYSMITTGRERKDYDQALDSFFSQFTTQLFYLNYAKSFYIYTLSSRYFREIFIEKIIKLFARLFGHCVRTRRRDPVNINQKVNHSFIARPVVADSGNL